MRAIALVELGAKAVLPVNSPIREALAGDASQRVLVALAVFDPKRRAVVLAKIELGKVAMQMLLTAVLIDALHAALEDAEVALDRVGVIVRSSRLKYSPWP